MKKLFAIFLTLILACSNFNVVSAQENLRSVDEIRAEIEKVRKELDVEILKNRISHRTINKLTLEDQLQKELSLLPLQNKLGDLKYDLAIAENRVISMEELIKSLKNQSQVRSVDYDGMFLEAGDILLFYGDSSGSSFDAQGLKNYIFNKATHGWSHALLVLDNGQGLHIWNGIKSQKIGVLDFLQAKGKKYDKIVVKKMSLNNTNKNFLTSYVDAVLLNRPYSDLKAQAMSRLSKGNYNNLYCSKGPWIAYNFAMQWDIDSDGGNLVKPIDILNSYYGYDYVIFQQ